MMQEMMYMAPAAGKFITSAYCNGDFKCGEIYSFNSTSVSLRNIYFSADSSVARRLPASYDADSDS